ncbi:MAG: putative DNA modification/repair radical SAM protein [Thermodesulfovibrionales bacterium]|nr:putative DNA modification/repair radical SAM protein [Thermodesulfovibrionales bacterium]
MDVLSKLNILSAAAKYDVSCASSGSVRTNTKGVGNTYKAGICHTWTDDGRCISLLKVLFTNYCIYDCAYCYNRRSNDIPRASFTPQEIADLTIAFYRRNYIEGLFLSSAIMKSADFTLEMMLEAVRILRFRYDFNGYIHMKVIPKADDRLIHLAGLLADRMSVNIELPTQQSLKRLACEKDFDVIFNHMGFIDNRIIENTEERKKHKKIERFTPAGQSTQLIIGASPETDYDILMLSKRLYNQYHLKRVYYSAYCHVNDDSRLPALSKPPLLREHRLYQADWLMRFYGFAAEEIIDKDEPHLNEQLDPKVNWALKHPEFFPVDVQKACYETLLRVPGIGLKSAKRIIAVRRYSTLDTKSLIKLGVVFKRAKYFITCNGKRLIDDCGDISKKIVTPDKEIKTISNQIALF